MDILDLQTAEFFATQPVIEEGGVEVFDSFLVDIQRLLRVVFKQECGINPDKVHAFSGSASKSTRLGV